MASLPWRLQKDSVAHCVLAQGLREDWPGLSPFISYGPWPSDFTSSCFSFLTCEMGDNGTDFTGLWYRLNETIYVMSTT